MEDEMLLRRLLFTHQCQTRQAVDAPHAGEREAGSLLGAHWRTATAVEAEKVPEA